MKNVLFLCTGNSCRSQMAEGWAKFLISDKYEFYSAGTKKSQVNPKAAAAMKEVGVDISEQFSKTTEELPDATMHFVITLCSDADQTCPAFPGGKVIHVPFRDPPRLEAHLKNDDEKMQIYRDVRDEIKAFVEGLAEKLES